MNIGVDFTVDPAMIRKKSMICWNVFIVDKLTVFRPASVMALTVKNNESMYRTLWAGVELPQKITEVRRHNPIK